MRAFVKQNSQSPVKVIIVNGLGRVPRAINILAKKYRKYGLNLSVFEVDWHAKESNFEDRFMELCKLTDSLIKGGEPVCLIGYSAGASVVLSIFEKFPQVDLVVTVNGKILNTNTIGEEYYNPNPSLRASIKKMDLALPKLSPEQIRKVICLKSLYDEVVLPSDATLPGAKIITKPYVLHAPSIALSLYFLPKFLSKSLYKV
jgi:hypothetical protein